MKIIRSYARLISGSITEGFAPDMAFQTEDGLRLLKHIEWCSRISHRSEDKQTDDSWKRLIRNVVIEHGDWSVVEHVSVSVDAVVDRGITHEWVRHRLFSFTQESTRFVNYEKKMVPSFIYPRPDVECEWWLTGEQPWALDLTKWGHSSGYCAYDPIWLETISYCESAYMKFVTSIEKGGRGWRPQEARSVFPNALASRIIVTGNLRNWRHFFIMRTTQETHPQMKQVTIPLLKEFQETFPILFDDIVPLQKQSESMSKIR